MKFGLTDKVIADIEQVFETNSKIDKAYIFGSRAKGNFKEGSDIDVALKGNDLTFKDILHCTGKLEELNLPYRIDLLDYDKIKEPDLKEHIDRVGIEFYSRWKEVKLGELIEKGRTNLQTGPFGTMLNASEYSKDGIPVIAVQDIGENKLVYHKFVFVDDTVAHRLTRYRVKENDIIFGRKGATDRRALIKKCEEGWLQGSDCIRLRLDNSIDSKFVSYQLWCLKDWMLQYSTGATMPSLNQEILKLLPLSLPPLSEQTAIASILSSLDDKIDLLHRQNKTLEQLAETLFRQWFVEEAEERWEQKRLPEIADYLNGLALQKFPVKLESLPVIKIREMKQGISENTDRCSKEIPEQYVIQDGDVLFSWSGSLEVVLWTGGVGALNQHLFKVTSKVYPKWFYYLATKYHLNDFKVIAESKSTTMGHIQREHLNKAMILIPPKELFAQFDKQIAPIIDKKIKNDKQIRTLTQTRDMLLPKLMSGEVRVNL